MSKNDQIKNAMNLLERLAEYRQTLNMKQIRELSKIQDGGADMAGLLVGVAYIEGKTDDPKSKVDDYWAMTEPELIGLLEERLPKALAGQTKAG